jgi:DNA-binding transcriptional ArsR family regulator
MSFALDRMPQAGASAISVYMLMLRWSTSKGIASIGIAQLSRESGRSPRWVQLQLKKLEQAGLIECVKRGRRFRTSRWRLLLASDWLEDAREPAKAALTT